MKVSFNIDENQYVLKEITLEDHYTMQIEIALSETPGFFITSYLSGCPEQDLRDLSMEQWDKIWSAVQVYLAEQNDSSKAPSPIIKLNKVEYGLASIDKLSIGEFADLDVIVSAKDFQNRAHEAMAILYRPVTLTHPNGSYEIEKYNIDTFAARAEIFRKCPISQVRRAIGFFLGFALQSLRVTLISLDLEEAEKMMPGAKEKVENLIRILGELGTELSLPSPMEISSISTALVQDGSERPSTTYSTKKTSSRRKSWSLKKLIKNINLN
jgi:hypothetical protein